MMHASIGQERDNYKAQRDEQSLCVRTQLAAASKMLRDSFDCNSMIQLEALKVKHHANKCLVTAS